MTKESAVYVRARELLADGEWHDYHKLVAKLIPLIEPGKAIRRAEASRVSVARRHNYSSIDERKVPRDPERLIRIGAAMYVRDCLTNGRVFEINPRRSKSRDGDKKIRWIGETQETSD